MTRSLFLLLPAMVALFACGAPSEESATETTDFPEPTAFIESLAEQPMSAEEAASQIDFSPQVMERAPRPYNFQDIPAGWIQPEHVNDLLELSTNEEECYIPIDPKECAAGFKVSTKGTLARQLLTAYLDHLSPTRAYELTPLELEQLKAQL